MKPAASKTVSKRSTSVNIDVLNIGLMLVSLVLAIKMPFTTFLFAYALLGPLHYLTEISWLRQHNFYLKKTSHANWLIAFSVVIVSVTWLGEIPQVVALNWFRQYANSFVSALYFVGFCAAVSMVVFEKMLHRAIMTSVAVLFAFLLYKQALYLFIFGVLIGTLMHVSLFTFAFVLLGSIKNKSLAGYLSLLVYVFCMLVIVFIPILNGEYKISEDEYNTFMKSTFQNLHIAVASFFSDQPIPTYNVLSGAAVRLQFFIAFAYTYHYFNWFSKVEIIKWHKAPGNTFLYIIIVWLLAVALYLYDYKFGLLGLLLLSIIHVFLEFPLNYLTFKNISTSLFSPKKRT